MSMTRPSTPSPARRAWREIAFQPSFAALDAALHECLPADQAGPFGAPFRWPSPEGLEAAFTNNGFDDVSVYRVEHPLIFEGGVAQVIGALAASPIAATVAALDSETAARLRSAAARHLEPLLADGQVRTQMVSNLVSRRNGRDAFALLKIGASRCERSSVCEPQFGVAAVFAGLYATPATCQKASR